MADEAPRYQVADQCYPTLDAAAQAWVAHQSVYQINFNFGFGDGIEPAFVVAQSVQVEENGDPGVAAYQITGVVSGSTDTIGLPWYPVICAEPSIPVEITPAAVTAAFGFGLGAVFMFWAFGYVIGLATGLIRKA